MDKQVKVSSPISPRPISNLSSTPKSKALTTSEVGRIVKTNFKEGQVVKGNSRINYLPYEKKVLQYQDRKVVKKIPVKRKVIQYKQRKYIEKVPRQVTKTHYYPVQRVLKNQNQQKAINQRPDSASKISFLSIEKQYSQQSRSISVNRARLQTQAKSKPKVFRAEDQYNLMMRPSKKMLQPMLICKRDIRYLSTQPSPSKTHESSRKFKVKINYQNSPSVKSKQKNDNDPYQIS